MSNLSHQQSHSSSSLMNELESATDTTSTQSIARFLRKMDPLLQRLDAQDDPLDDAYLMLRSTTLSVSKSVDELKHQARNILGVTRVIVPALFDIFMRKANTQSGGKAKPGFAGKMSAKMGMNAVTAALDHSVRDERVTFDNETSGRRVLHDAQVLLVEWNEMVHDDNAIDDFGENVVLACIKEDMELNLALRNITKFLREVKNQGLPTRSGTYDMLEGMISSAMEDYNDAVNPADASRIPQIRT